MAIQKEIWQNHIEGNLFKGNEFLLASTDASQYVIQGKVVHIPQAGATATVVKNRSSLPGTVVQRTDTDVTYALDAFTTDPILIKNAETFELSYSKRESVLAEHQASLRQVTADNILVSWAPSLDARIIRTTGSATATHLDSTTGTRARLTADDLKRAMTALNKQNIPMEGRVCVIDADMFDQLTSDLTATQYRDFSAAYDATNGRLGRLHGFDIYMRSSVLSFTNATTPVVNAYGAAANADDNAAALCFYRGAVERAMGTVTAFESIADPLYYGDIYSFEVRMGCRKRRTNEEGIIAIVQAAGGA